MKLKEVGLTMLGIISLFWPWISVKPFVDDDWDAELKSNTGLAAHSKDKNDKQRREYEPEVRKRLRVFRRGMWGSFFFLLSAIIVAIALTARYGDTSPDNKIWLGGASIFLFAWATLARLGKAGTSMGGKTVLERIDLRMMWILYWIGTMLGTLTLI